MKLRPGRLYIFPALIPLAEILPWLLSAVAALAGMTQAARGAFWRMHRTKFLSVALLCLMAAAGVIFWQFIRNPPKETGTQMTAQNALPVLSRISDDKTVLLPRPLAPWLEPLWKHPAHPQILTTPVGAGTLVLAGTFGASLDAYDAETGRHVWRLKKGEPVYGTPAIREDAAYVVEGLHTAISSALTAVSLPDGKPLWQREFLGHLESTPTLDDAGESLWLSAGPLGVWALEAKTGGVIWRADIGHTDAAPVLSAGVLYSAAQPDDTKKESFFYALSPDNGEVLWKTRLPGWTMGSPQVFSGQSPVFLTTAIGQVAPPEKTDRGWAHAIGRDGKIMWSVELPGMPLPDGLFLEGAGLYVLTLKTGIVTALDMASGKAVWETRAGKLFYAAATPVPRGKDLFLATVSTEGLLSFIHARDGRIEASYALGENGGYAAPLRHGDMLYIPTAASMLAYRIR